MAMFIKYSSKGEFLGCFDSLPQVEHHDGCFVFTNSNFHKANDLVLPISKLNATKNFVVSAFEAYTHCQKLIAASMGQKSTCSVFEKEPFRPYWDDKTVTELASHVRVYVTSWIENPIVQMFNSFFPKELKRYD